MKFFKKSFYYLSTSIIVIATSHCANISESSSSTSKSNKSVTQKKRRTISRFQSQNLMKKQVVSKSNRNESAIKLVQFYRFDLPYSPELGVQPNFVKKSVNQKSRSCIQVKVFDSVHDYFQIFFPIDGSQPTVEEAVEYSCANAPADSAVTDWYMKIFGVIPYEGGKFVLAGYNVIGEKRIIDFDEKSADNKIKEYISAFRKMASSPVGRVMLYRMLLEIRRKTGCDRNDVGSYIPSIGSERIGCVRIVFEKDTNRFSLSNENLKNAYAGEGVIFHDFSPAQYPVLKGMKIVMCKPEEDIADATIFHEMLHWFHSLTDPERLQKESYIEKKKDWFDSNIGSYYLIHKDKNEKTIEKNVDKALKCWTKIEELRNICGMPKKEEIEKLCKRFNLENDTLLLYYKALLGKNLPSDDLSENLYRLSVGAPIRVSHSSSSNIPKDPDSIVHLINTCNINYKLYNR